MISKQFVGTKCEPSTPSLLSRGMKTTKIYTQANAMPLLTILPFTKYRKPK